MNQQPSKITKPEASKIDAIGGMDIPSHCFAEKVKHQIARQSGNILWGIRRIIWCGFLQGLSNFRYLTRNIKPKSINIYTER